MIKCPGTDSRYLKVSLVKCGNCGYRVETFSDEVKTRCPKCKNYVYRKNMPSCIDWCKYAPQCIGGDFYKDKKMKKDDANDKKPARKKA